MSVSIGELIGCVARFRSMGTTIIFIIEKSANVWAAHAIGAAIVLGRQHFNDRPAPVSFCGARLCMRAAGVGVGYSSLQSVPLRGLDSQHSSRAFAARPTADLANTN